MSQAPHSVSGSSRYSRIAHSAFGERDIGQLVIGQATKALRRDVGVGDIEPAHREQLPSRPLDRDGGARHRVPRRTHGMLLDQPSHE